MTMTAMTWKLIAASVAAAFTVAVGTWGFAARPEQAASSSSPGTPVVALGGDVIKPGEQNASAALRARSVNRMKQILIAIHNYHEVNGRFPANVTDKDGKELLSWRVLLLPYLEQDRLYKQFKLDEPWDSANNKKLLAKMPDVFLGGFEKRGADLTYFQGFAGKGTMFEPGAKITLATVADGTSNSLAVIECGPPVEWTKPADFPYDPKKKLPKLEAPFKNAVHVALADGSVRAIKPTADETQFRRLIETNDGEVIDFDKLAPAEELANEGAKGIEKVVKENEKMIDALAEDMHQYQKLLLVMAKKKSPDDPIKGIDRKRLAQLHEMLEAGLAKLQEETDQLRQEAGVKK